MAAHDIMIGQWSVEVRREYTGSEARFSFPVRPLGWGRLLGVFLVGFGVLFCWGPAHSAWKFIQQWNESGPEAGNVIFSVFTTLFVIAGSIPAGLGLFILFGRCRVEWKEGQLRCTEMLGPLRWTRRMPRKPVRKFEVSGATAQRPGSPRRQFDRFAGLAAEFEDGSKKLVILGYPKDWLLALADELKTYVGGSTLSPALGEVEVVETLAPDEEYGEVLEQPSGSLVQVEEGISGVRLTVPAAGVWRGSKGLFAFALFWCGFMTVFTVVMAKSGFKSDDEAWIPILFVTLFWFVGLGLLAAAINMGRRTATFHVDGGRLRIEAKGLFGVKRVEWSRAELSAIRADASGIEVNNRPVIELQVYPVSGKKVGVLAGREEGELRWMASRLRQALNLPAGKGESRRIELLRSQAD